MTNLSNTANQQGTSPMPFARYTPFVPVEGNAPSVTAFMLYADGLVFVFASYCADRLLVPPVVVMLPPNLPNRKWLTA